MYRILDMRTGKYWTGEKWSSWRNAKNFTSDVLARAEVAKTIGRLVMTQIIGVDCVREDQKGTRS